VAKYLEKRPNANRMQLVSIFCCEMNVVYNLAQVHQVATGLAYLHARGIVHGDMKSVGSCKLCIDVLAFMFAGSLVQYSGE
jgi:serine/threonine protein kinase